MEGEEGSRDDLPKKEAQRIVDIKDYLLNNRDVIKANFISRQEQSRHKFQEK